MNEAFLQLSQSTVYRQVSGKLVVIEIDSGEIYYFNSAAKPFFDFFKSPRAVDHYLARSGVEGDGEQVRYLREFTQFLVENRILVGSAEGVGELDTESGAPFDYAKPIFLTKDDKKLDDIVMMTPPS